MSRTVNDAIKYKPVTRYRYLATQDRVIIENGYLYKRVRPPFFQAEDTHECDRNGNTVEFSFLRTEDTFASEISPKEGIVHRNMFWLAKRDDKRAKTILDQWLKKRKNSKLTESVERRKLGCT